MGEGVGGLHCPAEQCGECLDLSWAPVLLKSQNLVNRMLQERRKELVYSLGLRWCPVESCSNLIHGGAQLAAHAALGGNAGCCGGGHIPVAMFCAAGHGLCVACGKGAHSPLPCTDVVQWDEVLRKEIRNSDIYNAGNILVKAPHIKECPKCRSTIEKTVGSNQMQ